MGKLVIAGREVEELGPSFKNWSETGWDATTEACVQPSRPCSGPGAFDPGAKNKGPRRYGFRPGLRRVRDPRHPPLGAVQRSIRKFVLHHDGVSSARTCWNVLHNERGLSCHFLIDNDGTIFQTLDLAFMGFHAARFNVDSIGVELCNRGDAKKDYDYYKRLGQPRTTRLCKINGHTYDAWDFTPQQYASMDELVRVLVHWLPDLPLEYPKEPGSSKPLWGTMLSVDEAGDSRPAVGFAGYMAHYHLTQRKWDPGPFDFQRLIDKRRGQRCFPLWMPGRTPAADEKPLIPNDRDVAATRQKIRDAVAGYTALNEHPETPGGFFPVGPWGAVRLWHGGLHLPADQGSPVYAPFPGRVVAARQAPASPIGSRNFVLLRHELDIGRPLRFHTLYMHTAEEPGGDGAPRWMASKTRKVLDGAREVLGYDEAVEAGEIIGHVGVVGPGDLERPQIHFEVFSREYQFRGDRAWTMIDGSSGQRLSEVREINDLIDRDKDGRLSRVELMRYYTEGPVDDELRKLVTYHVSEWTDEPAWKDELARAQADFRKKSKQRSLDDDDEDIDLEILAQTQLEPFVWWTEPVATALNLVRDGTVYHYHPMRFLEHVNLQLLDLGDQHIVATAARPVDTRQVTDDSGGDHDMFRVATESQPTDLHLTIEHLEEGWAGDK